MTMGRPRAFDADKALEKAMDVFWRKGFEGASLADLTKAMGINPPSLYAAFGNKEKLFRKAVERYAAGPAAYIREAIDAPSAREVAEKSLRGIVELLADKAAPRGCLIVQGALACGDAADPLREELAARREATTSALRKRLERAKAEGDLPADADPATLARYLTTTIFGMAVQAASGASRKELRQVAELAMRAWPS